MTLRRAKAFAAMLDALEPVLNEQDCLVGSLAAVFGAEAPATAADLEELERVGRRGFATHADHVVIDFPRLLRLGLPGIRAEVTERLRHQRVGWITRLPGIDGDHPGGGPSLPGALWRCLRARRGRCHHRWEQMAARCDQLTPAPCSFPDAVQPGSCITCWRSITATPTASGGWTMPAPLLPGGSGARHADARRRSSGDLWADRRARPRSGATTTW